VTDIFEDIDTADPTDANGKAKGFRRFRARSKAIDTPEILATAVFTTTPGAADTSQAVDGPGLSDTPEAANTTTIHRTKDRKKVSTRRTPRRGVSTALLTLFVALGLATATFAGWQWGRTTDRQNRQSFDQRASGVAARVTNALQRDTDLTTATRAAIGQNPAMTNPQLASWLSESTSSGLVGISGMTYIETVSSAQFFYFRVAMGIDPTSTLSAGEPFTVTPSTAQPPYCMTRLLALRSSLQSAADVALPPGLDWCATSVNGALSSSRDTGQIAITKMLGPDKGSALNHAFGSSVVLLAPVYMGPTPTTVAGRRAALEGWVGEIVDAGKVLAGASGAKSNMQVTLARESGGSTPQVIATNNVTNATGGLVDTISANAGAGWIVTVRQPIAWTATGRSRGLLVGGALALVTLILFLILRALVVSRRRALEEAATSTGQLEHMAMHDVLTGLPNRTLVIDRAQQMLLRSRRSQLPTAALALGIDNFKEFNDVNGHQTGDELLKAVAERLSSTLRDADTIGRGHGDQFIVLTDANALAAGPELVAERIRDVLREPFYLGEGHLEPYNISASVGVALGPRVEAEQLLLDAETALSHAKESARGRYAVFGLDMPKAVENRQSVENELRSALVQKEFFLRYQPIFDIETRATTGVEALLRWKHATRGVIPPDHFLPVLEETGLIVPLGRWVLEEACRQGAALHGAGHPITMSVNMSAPQLQSDTLVADVGRALFTSGFEPNALVLEITETTIMSDTALMVDRLIALKGLGVRIAIDDFGTGYSSLAYLRQFPVDILKIDRSFISSLATTRDSSMLIHTLVQFGKTLGLETIAEGIEEEGQMDPLLAEQCDTGQGFLYGRPLSPTQLDIFLRTHPTQGVSAGGGRGGHLVS